MDRIYYDGACGLCHGWVRSVVRRDPEGRLFRFAPLSGPTFGARVPPGPRAGMAGTFVVETEEGRLLLRSDAAIHVLRRLGRRRTAALLALAPRPLRDLAYRAVARVRHLLRGRPRDSCPVSAPEALARFDP